MSCIKINSVAIAAQVFLSSMVVLLLAVATTPWAQAQTYEVLYTFSGGADGSSPLAGLIRDAAGNLYGTADGGTYGNGVVFKLSPTGKLTTLYAFTGGADGRDPRAGLIRDAEGNLYSTTARGGDLNCAPMQLPGCGVVFKLSPTGRLTTRHRFNAGGGELPLAGLVRDAPGNLYGITSYGGDLNCGGSAGCGVVFKLDTNGKEAVLHRFKGGVDGGSPLADLIRDAKGNLYGTTDSGGDLNCFGGEGGCGVVFKMSPTGKETVLYNFTNAPDGSGPTSPLLLSGAGDLYGTTTVGGELNCPSPPFGGCGVVFKLDPTGHETILYSFTGADGAGPYAGVVRDDAGNLYGTTTYGGGGGPKCGSGYGCGVVFKLDTTGHETVLHTFTGGSDGANPFAGLIRDSAGNLYGTAYQGGNLNCVNSGGFGCGVVFKVTP
jgi:uncharacterized repeat protein (TIGR03803 family)